MAPQAQHIKEEDQEECGYEASRAVLKPGGIKGKGDAPAIVKAAHKGKEAAVPVVKEKPECHFHFGAEEKGVGDEEETGGIRGYAEGESGSQRCAKNAVMKTTTKKRARKRTVMTTRSMRKRKG